jgi:hypothetical protein
MKALFTTQVYENYAWREDGTIGTGTESYWKAKGGDEYVVLNVDKDQVLEILEKVALQIERNDDYIQETNLNLQVVEDDYLTDYERDQLEYDGTIQFPAKVIEWQG